MAEVGLLIPIEESSQSGVFDDEVSWDLSIQAYDVPYEGNVEMDFAPVELFKVILTLTWQDGYDQRRSIDFVTLKAMTPDFDSQGLSK